MFEFLALEKDDMICSPNDSQLDGQLNYLGGYALPPSGVPR